MNPREYDEIGRVFLRVAAAAPTERDEVLENETGGDPMIIAAVQKMLRFDEAESLPVIGDVDLDQVISAASPTRRTNAGSSDASTVVNRSRQPASPSTPPPRLGDYELIDEIGRGGMGVVFRARQLSLGREVALKVFHRGFLETDSAISRFCQEAETVSRLDHPSIVPVYEVGQYEDYHFYSMRLVDGVPISAWAKHHNISIRDQVGVFIQLAKATHHAHQRGIIHRDLKPANVLIDANGAPHLIDFGIAKWIHPSANQTTVGQLLGTPNYLAPEQLDASREVTSAVDVYGMGALIYHTLTGQAPLHSGSVLETLLRVETETPAPPARLNQAIDADLQAITLKCLEKHPEQRYESALHLAEDLERWSQGIATQARPVSVFGHLLRIVQRRPRIAALVATLMIVTLIGFTTSAWQWRSAIIARERAVASENLASAQAERATQQTEIAREAESRSLQRLASLYRREANEAIESRQFTDAIAWDLEAIRARFPGDTSVDELTRELTPLDQMQLSQSVQIHPQPEALLFDDGPIRNAIVSPSGEWVFVSFDKASAFLSVTQPKTLSFRLDMPIETGVFHRNRDSFVAIDSNRQLLTVDLVAKQFRQTKPLALAVSCFDCLNPTDEIVVGDTDGRIYLLPLPFDETFQTRIPSRPIATHSGLEQVIASPDGQWLLAVGETEAWLHDRTTGELRKTISISRRKRAIAFSSDGRYLAVSKTQNSYLGELDVIDLKTNELNCTLQSQGYFTAVEFSEDTIITGDFAHQIQLWDAQEGKLLEALKDTSSPIESLGLGPEQTLAAMERDGRVHLWSLRDLERLETLRFPGNGHLVDCSQSEQRVVMVSDRAASVWTRSAPRELREIEDEGDRYTQRDFLNDDLVLTLASRFQAQFISLTDGRAMPPAMRHSAKLAQARLTADRNRVVAGGVDGNLLVWKVDHSVENGISVRKESQHSFNEAIIRLWPLQPASHVAVQLIDGRLLIWDTQKQAQVGQTYDLSSRTDGLVFPLDREWTSSPWLISRSPAQAWDRATARPVEALTTLARDKVSVNAVLELPDDRGFIMGLSNGDLQLRDAATLQVIENLPAHQAPVYRLALSVNGSEVASISGDGTVAVWEVGQPLTRVATLRHGDRVRSACFALDDALLVTSSFDGKVRYWDLQTASLIGPPLSLPGRVHLAQLSPDNTQLLINHEPFTTVVTRFPHVTTDINTKQLWNLATGIACGEIGDERHLAPIDPDRWLDAFRDAVPNQLIQVRDLHPATQ